MFEDIVWLHVESTTRCNAWCPFCPRSNNGFGLSPELNVCDLDLSRLDQIISQAKKLHTVQFCGNLGDPLAAKNFDEQLVSALSYDKIKNIQIHTNGSLRSQEWWQSLANKTKDVNCKVWFAIDGNAETHSYYRQGTSYQKIIDNASTFIQNGGKAVWQFIIFEHNKQNLVECYNKSIELGFESFKVIRNIRNDGDSLHYQTGKPLNIKNYSAENLPLIHDNEDNNHVEIKNCMHLSYPSLYLNANGHISPCCYLYNQSVDPHQIKKSFNENKFISTCLKSCGHIL